MSKPKTAITPTRDGELRGVVPAGHHGRRISPRTRRVRGCMVIKPWGYALWENMQRVLDGMFKATGHVNAYFPLFIPMSFLEKEAAHVEGFAKECAVVTHHRLEAGADGKLVPDRASSRSRSSCGRRPRRSSARRSRSGCRAIATCRCSSTSGRTSCAGRCARACSCARPSSSGRRATPRTRRATRRSRRRCRCSASTPTFAEDCMAMPVIQGEKTDGERFPGAVDTLLHRGDDAGPQGAAGRHVALPRPELRARRSGIQFPTQNGTQEHAWTTSWGVSTRLVGGLIMTHADDDGLVLPPRLAPQHVVIIPICRSRRREARACSSTAASAEEGAPRAALRRRADARGRRRARPARRREGVALGQEGRAAPPRDRAARHREGHRVRWAAATRAPKDKQRVPRAEFVAQIGATSWKTIQDALVRARAGVPQASTRARSTPRTSSTRSSQRAARSEGERRRRSTAASRSRTSTATPRSRRKIKDDLKVTVRCIPLEQRRARHVPVHGQAEHAARRLGEGVLNA